MAVSRLFGASVRRREDPRLITGQATYCDDIQLANMAYAVIVRSPYAHARITSIDTSAAAAHSGVIAVYTGSDLEGHVASIPCAWLIPDSDLVVPDHPPTGHRPRALRGGRRGCRHCRESRGGRRRG